MKLKMIKITYPEAVFINGVYFRTPVVFEYYDDAAIEHIKAECIQKGYKFEITSIGSTEDKQQIQAQSKTEQAKIEEIKTETTTEGNKEENQPTPTDKIVTQNQNSSSISEVQQVRKKSGRKPQSEKQTTQNSTPQLEKEDENIETITVEDTVEIKSDK